MKILISICTGVCLLIHLGCNAQQSDLDSLNEVKRQYAPGDSLYHQASLKYAEKYRQISLDTAILLYEKLAQICQQHHDLKTEINCYTGIGISHAMKGNYAETIIQFNKGLAMATEANYIDHMAGIYNNLGIVYKRISNYPLSLSFYSKSMALYDSTNNLDGLASSYQNVAIVYDLMQEPDMAMDYYEKALALNEHVKDDLSKANLESNIGIIYLDKKDYNLANHHLQKALAYYRKAEIHGSVATQLSNLGFLCIRTKAFDQAEKHLVEALSIADKLNLLQSKTVVSYNMAELELARNRTDPALTFALQNAQLSDSLRSNKHKADAQLLLSRVYEKLGKADKALVHYKQHTALKDSLFNESKARAYKSHQVGMEVFVKDRQIAEQSMEINFLNQRISLENRWKWTLAAASLFLLLAGTTYYQKFRQRHKYSTLLETKNNLISTQKQEIEAINHQLENKLLRAQMNPHFIFNALNSIQHFITINDKRSALHYLSSFSRLLRQVLDSPYHTNLILKEEINFLQYYLELEALRFGQDFEYYFHIDEGLDTENHEVPMMVIQPFIENAIHHGLMPSKNRRLLEIYMQETESTLQVIVKDNGIGREAAEQINKQKKRKSKSRGMSVTSQRLQLLARNHGVQTEVAITDLKDRQGKAAGTEVKISIPKQ